MTEVERICGDAKAASFGLAFVSAAQKNEMLLAAADAIEAREAEILAANARDVARSAAEIGKAMTDRLALDHKRIAVMAEGVRQVAALPDPVGEITGQWTRPNGMRITKIRAPLGVAAVIYEARPNVTADVAALCLKSGNSVVLRGGKEAIESNRAIYNAIADALREKGFDPRIVGFIDDVTRESTAELLRQDRNVDVIIPRGGEGLKKFILANSSIPVIFSAGGNCHIYIEKSADPAVAESVVYNAKMSRPSVCNALEQLLIDESVAGEILPALLGKLRADGCRIKGCARTRAIFPQAEAAQEADYETEFHDYVLNVRVVRDYEEAIARINRYNTKHSDGIISRDAKIIDVFQKKVDAACVYVNVSTRFTDGFEFGFGAEIAVSTQKLHARGPLGLQQLTCEKYLVEGEGQIRE